MIPADVVFNILLKLPVKSLLRCRSVCKEWCLLLDSPCFVSKRAIQEKECILVHRLIENQEHAFSFASEETLDIVLPDFDAPLMNGRACQYLCGPINGIICLAGAVGHDAIFLCNPSTREFKLLSPCIFSTYKSRDLKIRNVGKGFGFDEKTNDYKFLRIVQRFAYEFDEVNEDVYTSTDLGTKFEIYNLSSNSWRELDHLKLPRPSARFNLWQNAYFKGACHWFVGVNHDNGNYEKTIISFRMDDEVFEEVELLPCVSDAIRSKWETLLVWNNEYLSVIVHDYIPENTGFEVWVMKEYRVKESWTKQITVSTLPMPELFLPTKDAWYDEERDGQSWSVSIGMYNELLLHGANREVVLWDLEDTEKIRFLKACERVKKSIMNLAFYRETLVSIKRGNWGTVS